jgi:hypothetical protein
MKKLNCWEVKKCGRESEGAKVKELGICPASTEERLDDIHGGKNAGRVCWAVAGTFCEGKVQGTYAQKYGNCAVCEFFIKVRHEEGKDYLFTSVILKKIK